MRSFTVKWCSEKDSGVETIQARNQSEAMMQVMRKLSPDGVHAIQCRINVKPL